MDMSLAELYKREVISYDTALNYSVDKDLITKIINL